MQNAFTPEDAIAVLRKMKSLALDGNVAAAKVFLEYTLGKPTEAPDPDRESQHAWELREQSPKLTEVLEVTSDSIPAEQAEKVVSQVMPLIAAHRLQSCFRNYLAATTTTGSTGDNPPQATQSACGHSDHDGVNGGADRQVGPVSTGDEGDKGPVYRPASESTADFRATRTT